MFGFYLVATVNSSTNYLKGCERSNRRFTVVPVGYDKSCKTYSVLIF